MKILFIGNSYTYYNDMPSLLGNLTKENGAPAEIFSITKGGRKLYEFEDPADPYTQKLDELLSQHDFDVTILQEQSLLPAIHFEDFERGILHLIGKLTGHTRRIILYSTWGRKPGSPDLEKHDLTTESMTAALSHAYTTVAKRIGAEVSYVGLCFYAATSLAPALELYHADGSHPSYTGSCLAALCHYHTIYGTLPASLSSLGLDSEAERTLLDALTHVYHT